MPFITSLTGAGASSGGSSSGSGAAGTTVKIKDVKLVTLWENASPLSEFGSASKTSVKVELDLSAYGMVYIEYLVSTGNSLTKQSVWVTKGQYGQLAFTDGRTTNYGARRCYVEEDGVTFEPAYNHSATNVYNYAIPTAIYGAFRTSTYELASFCKQTVELPVAGWTNRYDVPVGTTGLYRAIEFNGSTGWTIVNGPMAAVPETDGSSRSILAFAARLSDDGTEPCPAIFCVGGGHINTAVDEGISKLYQRGFSEYEATRFDIYVTASSEDVTLEDYLSPGIIDCARVYSNYGSGSEQSAIYVLLDLEHLETHGAFLPYAEDLGWSVSGKKLLGWSVSRSGGTVLAPGSLYVPDAADTFPSLYAVWVDDTGDAYTQTAEVEGLSDDAIVIVAPAPGSHKAYVDASVYASAQGTNAITFTAEKVPSEDLVVSVVWPA